MFRASSAHPQEVSVVNCTCMQPLVFSFSAGGRLVPLLRGDREEGKDKKDHVCDFMIFSTNSFWRKKVAEERWIEPVLCVKRSNGG